MMDLVNSDKRKEYIDMAKGIGILLVIYGHCMSSVNGIVAWQCSFFMPLFFICSGLCTSRPKNLKQNARRVLPAYYIWGGVGLVLEFVLLTIKHELSIGIVVRQLVKYGFGIGTYNYPLWFLVAFFVGKCFFDGTLRISLTSNHPLIIQIVMAIVCFTLGMFLAYVRRKYSFFYPFRLDIGLTMVPFLFFGYWMRGLFERIEKRKKYKQILIGGGLLFINMATHLYNGLVSVNSSEYGNSLLFLLSSLSGSCFIIIMCQVIMSLVCVKRWLCWYGINSLRIMCTHAIILLFIVKGIIVFNQYWSISSTAKDYIAFICCVLIMIPICRLWTRLKNVKL